MVRDRPAVHVLATGGTIANPPEVDGYLPGRELVENVPAVGSVAEITAEDVASTGSSGVTPALWYALHERIEAGMAAQRPPDGFVVTHGSNTAEETAYFLNLTVGTDRPVVVTAAQRNHATVGNDGDRNLLDSVRVAADPEAAGRGALVVVNDQIHHAREVTKTVSGRPDAWTSGEHGVLGMTDKRGLVRFYRRTERRHAPDTPFEIAGRDPDDFPTVGIVYAAAGADGSMVEAAVERGVEGLVVAALPTGSPAEPAGGPTQTDALERAVEAGVPVVVSHRGLDGWPKRGYLDEGPFIWGDTLTPQKARVLLALGRLETDDRAQLQDYFLEY
jgi:L-asparaginase